MLIRCRKCLVHYLKGDFIMRAYSDVYLSDVVENQGKLFDLVAQRFPDNDTEDFINTYMQSKARKSINV